MVIGSGIVLLNPPNVEYATLLAGARNNNPAVTTNGEKLGGTTGGVNFQAEPDFTNLGDDLDGLSSVLRGSQVINDVAVTLEATVVEFVPGKIKRLNPFLEESVIYSDGVRASTTRGTGNAGVKIEADAVGTGGNSITYAQVVPAGANAPLSVSVVGSAITVNVATGATAGTATSTADQVIAAINANPAAAALVTASRGASSDGSGVVAASASAALTGGAAGTTPAGITYTPRAFVKDTDHIDRVVAMFESKDKDIRIAVELFNCLVTSAFGIQGQGNNEKIGVDVTLMAMSGANNFDTVTGTYPPAYKIHDFSVAA